MAPTLYDQVLEKYQRHVNPGLAALVKFIGFEGVEWEAQGAVIRDSDGNEYLDCLGGFGALSLGHRHPRVVEAVKAQLERMPLSSKILFSQPLADLAERLAQVLPGDLSCSFFCNSGTEAVEGALKLARLHTGRTEFISTTNAFHGKTFGGLSASGRDLYRAPFQPLLPGFEHLPFGDAEAMEGAIGPQTAAVILEPIQGEAGVIIPPDDYLPRVRAACSAKGVLLILDEVQTGLGRTGEMFACQHSGVVPDIITLAKALGGGVMPLGAFSSTPEVWKVMEPNPLLHSSTFGGNPLACAAGLAALAVTAEEDLPGRARRLGGLALGRLGELRGRFPELIRDVRGKGLLIGVEFSEDDLAGLVISGLAQRKVIAAYTLNNPKVIRLEPPLVITEEQLDRALVALEEAVAQTAELVADLA